MNFPTEISPDAQLILDELRKLSAMQSELFADLAVTISRVATPSAAAACRMIASAPSSISISPAPAPPIVADNWGGLFDGGDDPDEQHPEAPIVADGWGGLCEQPAHILDEYESIERIRVESCFADDPIAIDVADGADIVFAGLTSTNLDASLDAGQEFVQCGHGTLDTAILMEIEPEQPLPEEYPHQIHGDKVEQPTHILDERESIEQIRVESCLASTDSNVIFAELAPTDQICVEGAYTFPNLNAPVCFTPAPNASDAATSSTKEKDPVEAFQAEYQIQKLEKLPSSTTGKAAATVEVSVEREKRTRNFLVGDPSAPPPPRRAPLLRRPRRFPPRPPRPRRQRHAPPLPLRLRRPRRPPWLCRPPSPRTRGPRRDPLRRRRPLRRLIWRPPWRLTSFNRRPRLHVHRVRGCSLRPGQRRQPPWLQGLGRRPRLRARALLPHLSAVRRPVRTPPHRQRGCARRILRDAARRPSRPQPSRRLLVQAGPLRRLVHAQHQLGGHHRRIVKFNLPQGPPWLQHNCGDPATISIHAQVVLAGMLQRYNTNLTSATWMGVDLSGSSAAIADDNQKVFEELSAQNLVQLAILGDSVYTVPVHLTISQPTILWESLGCIQEYMSTFTVACLVVGLEGMDPCRNQHGLRGALNLLLPMYLCDGLAWWQRIRAAKTVLDTNLDIAGHMASVYAVGCPCLVGAASIEMTGILCEAPQHHGDWSGYDTISVILLDKQLADLGCVGVPCSEAYNSVLHLSFSDRSFVAQVDLFRLEPWDPGGKQLLLFVDTAVCVMILWHVQRKCGANCRCFLLEVIGQNSQVAGRKVKDHWQVNQELLQKFLSSGPSSDLGGAWHQLISLRCYCGRLWKPPWPIQICQQIRSVLTDLTVPQKYMILPVLGSTVVCDSVDLRPIPWPAFSALHELTVQWCLNLIILPSAWWHLGGQCEVFVTDHSISNISCCVLDRGDLHNFLEQYYMAFRASTCHDLVSVPLFYSELLVNYELIETRIASGDFLQTPAIVPSELYVLHSISLYCIHYRLVPLARLLNLLFQWFPTSLLLLNGSTGAALLLTIGTARWMANGFLLHEGTIVQVTQIDMQHATATPTLTKVTGRCVSQQELKQQEIVQFPWDPGGSDLFQRLGGKPKLKKGGMSASTHRQAFIWAVGLGLVSSCLLNRWPSSTRELRGSSEGHQSIKQLSTRKVANNELRAARRAGRRRRVVAADVVHARGQAHQRRRAVVAAAATAARLRGRRRYQQRDRGREQEPERRRPRSRGHFKAASICYFLKL